MHDAPLPRSGRGREIPGWGDGRGPRAEDVPVLFDELEMIGCAGYEYLGHGGYERWDSMRKDSLTLIMVAALVHEP